MRPARYSTLVVVMNSNAACSYLSPRTYDTYIQGPSEGVCPVSFTEKKSSARERLEPAALLAPQYWRPVVSLADGIQQFYAQVAVSGGSKQGQEEEDREKEEAREEEEGLDTGVSQGDDDQRGMKDEL